MTKMDVLCASSPKNGGTFLSSASSSHDTATADTSQSSHYHNHHHCFHVPMQPDDLEDEDDVQQQQVEMDVFQHQQNHEDDQETHTQASSFWLDGLESIPVYAVDGAGCIIAWNRAMHALTGWPAASVQGRPFAQICLAVDVNEHQPQHQQHQQPLEIITTKAAAASSGESSSRLAWNQALGRVLQDSSTRKSKPASPESCSVFLQMLQQHNSRGETSNHKNGQANGWRPATSLPALSSGAIPVSIKMTRYVDPFQNAYPNHRKSNGQHGFVQVLCFVEVQTANACHPPERATLNKAATASSQATPSSQSVSTTITTSAAPLETHDNVIDDNDDGCCSMFGILGVDVHGTVAHWNHQLVEWTGYQVHDMLGRPFDHYVTVLPSQVASASATTIVPSKAWWITWIRACCDGHQPNPITIVMRSCHSEHFNSDINESNNGLLFLRLHSSKKQIAGLPDLGSLTQQTTLLVENVSDLYRTEQEKLELQHFLETANVAMVGLDFHGKVNFWNNKMTAISGFLTSEVIGQSLLEQYILSSWQPSLDEILQDAMHHGKVTANYELEFRTKSGDVRYLLVNVSPRRRPSLSHHDHESGEYPIFGVMLCLEDVTESAQHYRRVAAMTQEYRQLLDTANVILFGVDESGRVNEWNDKTVEITGISADEAFDKPFIETMIAPHLQESVQSVLSSALRGRGTTNYEMELRTQRGGPPAGGGGLAAILAAAGVGGGGHHLDTRSLLATASTRRDADHHINGVVFIAQDITEASKHDRAVASMASELRQLIDTANAPIFGCDCDGDVNEWNDKTAEITGYTKEEAFDCSLIETFIVPHMQASVQEILDNALQGRGTSNYELEFRTRSNEIRHLLVNATTRRDAENNIVGVVGVAQDVTEAVQRDRAVAGMALELRQLIDTANAPIFGIDIDGNVNEWNRRTQEITGYSKEETFDEPLVERFIAPSMQQKVQEILDAALHGNETSNYELEFVAKSGEPRFMLVNATTRRDPEFNVVGVVGVAQDVTEHRKHAAELRKMQYLQATQEAKVETERNMTAYFAHELRNPLGAIDSALSSMPDDLQEPAKSLVSAMQLCSSFMSSIMNNLLDVRKMEEGKMTLNVVPVSLSAVAAGVHKMLLPSVKPGVEFTAICNADGKDWVLGDEHRIQQVLTNVVTNAIKYTVSGSITVRVGWEGANVKFECVDTGPGIPCKEQEKLFQRFVQRGGAPGTGLGLAIAKHLVDLTKGSIRFDSDPSIRPGTTCVILMPLAICDHPDITSARTENVPLIQEPLRLLIIDDVKMNRMMLKRRIEKGIAPNSIIAEACTGEEALEICGKNEFDVIIVDQYMEEAGGLMVGTDVVYAMRRMRIKSIIIGCSGNDLNEEFNEAGADWVWQKPMPSNARIIEHLREALATRQGDLSSPPTASSSSASSSSS